MSHHPCPACSTSIDMSASVDGRVECPSCHRHFKVHRKAPAARRPQTHRQPAAATASGAGFSPDGSLKLDKDWFSAEDAALTASCEFDTSLAAGEVEHEESQHSVDTVAVGPASTMQAQRASLDELSGTNDSRRSVWGVLGWTILGLIAVTLFVINVAL